MKRSATVHRLEDHRHLCPNCARRFADLTAAEHTESGCFLGMLVGVIQGRLTMPVTSAAVAAFEDVDGLWDRWGSPAADELEEAIGRPSPAALIPAPEPTGPGGEER